MTDLKRSIPGNNMSSMRGAVARRSNATSDTKATRGERISTSAISRRAFLAGAGTVLASLTLPLVSGPIVAFAEDASDERIVIVHTNDVHCSLKNAKTGLGYAALMDYVNTQRNTYGTNMVSLVDAGDNIQGDFDGSFTKGKTPAQVIAACDYDVLTLGNHEFDYGMNQLLYLQDIETHDSDVHPRVVCCNFQNKDSVLIYNPYRVLEYQTSAGTVRIAYVGVTTPSTITSSTPTSFKDEEGNYIYGFCGDASGQELYDAVQAAVDEARSVGKADYVVLLAHLGQQGALDRWRSDTVVANTTGIDIVIDGHSHEMYVQTKPNKLGQDVVIAQTGTKFMSFGRVEINPATGTATASLDATGVSAELIKQWDGEDAEVSALVEELQAKLEKIKDMPVCSSEVFLRAWDDDGSWAVRKRETNLANLVADAFLYHVANYDDFYDIALVNAGSVRANIEKGDVTYGNVVSVVPYLNQLCGVEVSGQHLLDMLEIGAAAMPNQSGALLHASEGMTYTVRLDIPTPVVYNEDRSAVERFEGERRVKNAQLNGKDIDPAGTYKVLSNLFILVSGGDRMPVPENADDAEYLGMDVDALIDYLTVNLKGVIGEAYANESGQGRIKILDHDDSEDDKGGGSGDGDDKHDGSDDSGKGSGDGGSSGDGNGSNKSNGSGNKKSSEGLPQTGDTAGAAAVAAGLVGAAVIASAAGLAE